MQSLLNKKYEKVIPYLDCKCLKSNYDDCYEWIKSEMLKWNPNYILSEDGWFRDATNNFRTMTILPNNIRLYVIGKKVIEKYSHCVITTPHGKYMLNTEEDLKKVVMNLTKRMKCVAILSYMTDFHKYASDEFDIDACDVV